MKRRSLVTNNLPPRPGRKGLAFGLAAGSAVIVVVSLAAAAVAPLDAGPSPTASLLATEQADQQVRQTDHRAGEGETSEVRHHRTHARKAVREAHRAEKKVRKETQQHARKAAKRAARIARKATRIRIARQFAKDGIDLPGDRIDVGIEGPRMHPPTPQLPHVSSPGSSGSWGDGDDHNVNVPGWLCPTRFC